MYLSFYQFKEKPFNLTPDPKFLYLTPGHREALAQLQYGVQERKGFIVLTGEVGTGKTTLLQALLKRLDGTAAVAFIVNSKLSFDEMLEYALEDFGIAHTASSRPQRLFALNGFLTERCRAGQNTVLILDEAQNLDPLTLEQVRLLSNFETPTEKLLQILLVGQPELKVKLQLPELRQLKQRIGLRCSIPPLRPEETRDYILRRLRLAGARDVGLFTEPAISRIAEYAAGIPRTVNMVCDHCLLIGYADQRRRIDREIVDQAIAYLEDELPLDSERVVTRRWRVASRRPVVTASAAALLGGGVVVGHYANGLAKGLSRLAGSFYSLAAYLEDKLPLDSERVVTRRWWVASRRPVVTASAAALLGGGVVVGHYANGLAKGLSRLAGSFYSLAKFAREWLNSLFS